MAKRVVSIVTLALFMSQVSLPVWEGAVKAWADVGTNVAAPLKSEVGLEETDELAGGGRKSNVLFLIEATAAMSFTPKGVLPQAQMTSGWDLSFVEGADWNKTRERFEYGPEEINRMMKEATFGMGALPAAWSGLDLRPERNLYGRDPDDTNNFVKGDTLKETMELNADNYYFPFVSDDNPIANGLYKGQKTGLEIGFADSPEVWPYSTVERSTAFESKDRAGYPTNHDYGHWDGAKYSWYYDTKASAADKGYYKSTKPKNKNGERDSGASNTALHIRHTAPRFSRK